MAKRVTNADRLSEILRGIHQSKDALEIAKHSSEQAELSFLVVAAALVGIGDYVNAGKGDGASKILQALLQVFGQPKRSD